MAKPYVPYEGPIVTRAEAEALGLKRFFPGSRCRRAGHLSERMIVNGACCTCLAIRSEAWRLADPERAAASVRASEVKHRERKLQRGRAYSKAHQPESAAWKRARNAKRLAAKLAARIPDPSDYTGPVVSRVEARARGATHFFTGKPCKHNHLSQRNSKNGGCIKCNVLTHQAHLRADGTPQQAKLLASKRVVKHRRRSRDREAEGKFAAADILRIGDLQKWKCHWCSKPTKKHYHVDHLIPLAKGGANRPSNLVIACPQCNLRKNATDPVEYARRIGLLI